MKRLNLLLLCAMAMTIAVHAQGNVKFMSYNVHNSIGMDGVSDCQRIANVIINASPDVVAVQELDSMTTRSQQKYILGELARHTLMHATYAPTIDYQGGKYGIGILSREKPLNVQRHPLPGREEHRALLVAEFKRYIFCCTHFSLTEEDQRTSVDIIKQIVANSNKPLFLAGDLNASPDSEVMKAFAEDFILLNAPEVHTFSASNPGITIDYILAWKHSATPFANLSAQVLNEPVASDHLPLTVELRMAVDADELFATSPYLQNPTSDGITVMWETNTPTYSWVEYGTDTLNLSRARVMVNGQAQTNESIHKIRLEGLTPGETYYYRACSQEVLQNMPYHKTFGHTAQSGFHSFTLPDTDAEEFTAIVFNDLHCNAQVFDALQKQVKDIDYDFVMFNGDCVSDPENREQATWFIKTLTEGVNGNSIPTLFLRGNHEVREAYATQLHHHFDYAGGKPYGAFSWGDTRIVMLDCGESNPDTLATFHGLNDFSQYRKEQVEFLHKELKSKAFKRADKRILIHHIPLFGECKELWSPLLNKASIDIALNGHTHRVAHHEKGAKDNDYPILVGGGKQVKTATVMILEKKKGELRIKVINAEGTVLHDITV